jgi:hypothetical protein
MQCNVQKTLIRRKKSRQGKGKIHNLQEKGALVQKIKILEGFDG